jgi:hypothetical protein
VNYASSNRQVNGWVGYFFERFTTFAVNFLTIHNDFFGSGNAKTYCIASDVYYHDTDVLAHTDRFTDFSCQNQHTDLLSLTL